MVPQLVSNQEFNLLWAHTSMFAQHQRNKGLSMLFTGFAAESGNPSSQVVLAYHWMQQVSPLNDLYSFNEN